MARIIIINGVQDGRVTRYVPFDDNAPAEIELALADARRAHVQQSGAAEAVETARQALVQAELLLQADIDALKEPDPVGLMAAIAELTAAAGIDDLVQDVADAVQQLKAVQATAAAMTMDARAAADRFLAAHPEAFEVADPGGDASAWRIEDGAAVLDPPPPPRVSVLSYSDFEDRFTKAEQDALADLLYSADSRAVHARPRLMAVINRAIASNTIDLDARATAAFMDAIVEFGVIAPARRPEILDLRS